MDIEIDGPYRSEKSMVMASMANSECHNQRVFDIINGGFHGKSHDGFQVFMGKSRENKGPPLPPHHFSSSHPQWPTRCQLRHIA